jgi:exosortase/archaeosortase family protein
MFTKMMDAIKKLRANKRLEPIIDTSVFILITFTIHYLYRYWEYNYDHRIFGFQVITPAIFTWFTNGVFMHSKWLVGHFLSITTIDRTFFFENGYSLNIVFSCSGIKQMLQFALLILLYPGPWKHKAWYIPMGLVMIHLTNVIRISGLCVTMAYWPQHWHFAHDYPFRVIFYVVIFFLWVIWNDRFYHTSSKSQVKSK